MLVSLVVWHGTLFVPFHFDDVHTVMDNPTIRELGNCKEFVADFFNQGLLHVGYTLNYVVADKSPEGVPHATSFHTVNLLMHVANAFLAYCLVLAVLGRRGGCSDISKHKIAAGVALLFAVSPVQTMAVNLIASRAVVQAAMFSLVSLISWVGALDPTLHRHKRMALFVAAIVAMLCSLASKSVGISTIGLTALISYFLLPSESKKPKNFAVLFMVSGAIGALGVGLLAGTANVWQDSYHGVWTNLLTQARVVIKYIQLLAFPTGLNVDHDQPLAYSLFQPHTALAVLAICALLGTGILLTYRRSLLGLSVMWFFVAIAPSSSIVPRLDVMIEYRVYLAVLGFAGAEVWILHRAGSWLAQGLPSRVNPRRTTAAILILVVGALSLGTMRRNKVFADPVSLWADAAAKSPKKFRPNFILGISLGEQGKLDEAIVQYGNAIRIKPDEVDIRINLGNALARKGRLQEAISEYSEALRLRPYFPHAHNNLGLILAQQGRIDEAIAHFSEAIRENPEHVTALANMGNALATQGNLDLAISFYTKALRMEPQFAEAHYYIGTALARKGKLDDAISHYSEALRLKPDYTQAQTGLQEAVKKTHQEF